MVVFDIEICREMEQMLFGERRKIVSNTKRNPVRFGVGIAIDLGMNRPDGIADKDICRHIERQFLGCTIPKPQVQPRNHFGIDTDNRSKPVIDLDIGIAVFILPIEIQVHRSADIGQHISPKTDGDSFPDAHSKGEIE